MPLLDRDYHVLIYQAFGDSEGLVKQYENFLNKYYKMIRYNSIDFTNHDIREFFCAQMSDQRVIAGLRRAKFHSRDAVAAAQRILNTIRFKLEKYRDEEIYHEILIPFLRCASQYKDMGVGFERYLYKSYRYELKRHLDRIMWDPLDGSGALYQQDFLIEEKPAEEDPRMTLMDEIFELSDPDWIHGVRQSPPFQSLTSHERYILVKYYLEGHTDREIAKMLPYNPKSIHRIRTRLKRHFHSLYEKGELKWIRLH